MSIHDVLTEADIILSHENNSEQGQHRKNVKYRETVVDPAAECRVELLLTLVVESLDNKSRREHRYNQCCQTHGQHDAEAAKCKQHQVQIAFNHEPADDVDLFGLLLWVHAESLLAQIEWIV